MYEISRKRSLGTFVGRKAIVRSSPRANLNTVSTSAHAARLHVFYGMADDEGCELGRLRCWDARTPGATEV